MSDGESIKKMLRSVLQASKDGVSMHRLQAEYRSLCGEFIPHKQLGYPTMEAYLRSIPSVVRLDFRMGELKCFAAVCEETAHIAQLVARQKSSKRPGRSQVVNCRMRSKTSSPYMLNVRPRCTLRQPSGGGSSGWVMNRPRPYSGYRGFSAPGDYRGPAVPQVKRPASTGPLQPDKTEKRLNFNNVHKPTASSFTERPGAPGSKTKPPQAQPIIYDVEQDQSRVRQLLAKYSSGLWLSKLPSVYQEMFRQQLHPQTVLDLEKWTHICSVEQPGSTNRADRLVYPPVPPKPSTASTTSTITTTPSTIPAPPKPTSTAPTAKLSSLLTPSPSPKPTVSPTSPLAKPAFHFPLQPITGSTLKPLSSVTLRSPALRETSSATLGPRWSVVPNDKPRPPTTTAASNSFSLRSPNGGVGVKPSSPTTTINHSPNPNPNHSLNLNSTSQPPSPTGNFPATPPPSSFLLRPSPPFLSLLIPSEFTFSPTTSEPAPTPLSSPTSPALSSPSAVPISADVRAKLKELLSKYSQGLWAHALPKLFMESYKTPFPEHVLGNLSLLLDICTLEYPMPGNKRKAILYSSSLADLGSTTREESQTLNSPTLPSGLRVLSSVVPPSLELPKEQYPSVLVTDVKNSNTITVRFVGKGYSKSHEAMEESMRSFYSQSFTFQPLSNPVIGQLAAVRVEGGDEVARAQVMELTTSDKVKVYYMDDGYAEETSRTRLLELHQDFLTLPFQATNVRLAGLDAFVSHPSVVSTLDSLTVGKILLMETVEPRHQKDTPPLVVLYDTSQDDDVNVNAACLKSLQDRTMDNPLTVNSTYQDVCVTTVCPDGILYCQLPSRGTVKLNELLDKIETFFISQVTSESLVSRPFCGKLCLARYEGKWSRVEIANLHGSRVMDIEFIDLGVQSSVEVTELREIPPPFLNDLMVIPPQAIKCCLADLPAPAEDWKSEAVLWLKDAILHTKDCSMKIIKLDQDKGERLVHILLFTSADRQQEESSINHQLVRSELWQRLTEPNNNTITLPQSTATNNLDAGDLGALVEKLSLNSPALSPPLQLATQAQLGTGDMPFTLTPAKTTTAGENPLLMPPLLELPQPKQNMDVYVPVACHPGHFVVQPWQDMYKLVVLMGEMILYYNKTEGTAAAISIEKREVYAAKVDKNWHRVLVKGVLTNGLVSVYELDYGKHELVSCAHLQPLIEEFRQLPFQAITAQLAGVEQHQWSEEASMVFRNHVENRALVAQVESVQDGSESSAGRWSKVKGQAWERKVTVYLVDTSQTERDVWIHEIMADMADKLSTAA